MQCVGVCVWLRILMTVKQWQQLQAQGEKEKGRGREGKGGREGTGSVAKQETDFSRGNDKNYTKSIAYQANNGTENNNNNNSKKGKDKDKDVS